MRDTDLYRVYKKETTHRIYFDTRKQLDEWQQAMNIKAIACSGPWVSQIPGGTWELRFLTESIESRG